MSTASLLQAAGGVTHWVEASGTARLRVVHWPAGARGTVLLLGGWKDYVEKNAETVADLQARGFAVWALDWRGQGASTRPLPDRHRSHIATFDLFLADLDRVLDQLILPASTGPLIMIGHSMGGHLAARILARRPGLFDRAILLAPMMDFLRGSPAVRAMTRAFVNAMCRIPGTAARYAPGTPRAPMIGRPFQGNRLTGCPERYATDDALLRSMPEMQLGGVTWGWLRAALDSIALLQQPGFAEAIELPVLTILAGHEQVTENEAARRFAARLPRGTLIEIDGARHELLRERDEYRLPVWAAIDRFLAEA